MTVARGINVFSTRATAEFRVQRCCAHPGRSLSSQRVGPHRAPSMPRRDMSAVRRHPRNVLAQASLELKERGIRFDPSQVKTLRLLGEGSFGSVYEGELRRFDGDTEHIILKRVKNMVAGADEMGQMEHVLNVYVQKNAPGCCADFRGYVESTPETATKSIGEGLWLIWRYEGRNTLSYYLRRRDTLDALARDMDVPKHEVVPTAMRQILEALQQLHSIGLVHRDVKPLNIILCEKSRRLKLIDLGACADLRQGTNFNPQEAILDPLYCPPENYVLPTDAPDIARQSSIQKAMVGPLLWMRYKPDRYDVYSVGLILMQLCVPPLRNDKGLRQFADDLRNCKYNLRKWRKVHVDVSSEAELLDTAGGLGWDLASQMLMPREHVTSGYRDAFSLQDVLDPPRTRVSVQGALAHPFLSSSLSRELEEAMEAVSKRGRGKEGGVLEGLVDKVNDLYARISKVASVTKRQEVIVESLTLRLQAGEDVETELSEATRVLGKLQGRLNTLQAAFGDSMAAIQRMTGSTKRKAQQDEEGQRSRDATNQGASNSKSGDFMSGVYSGIGGVLGSLLNSKGAAKTGGTAKAFVNMLHEVVPMDARYIGRLEEVEQLVAGDPRYDAVAPEARDALFEVFLEERQARLADSFREMMMEVLGYEGLLSAGSWSAARGAVKRDARFQALEPEAAREEIFRELFAEAERWDAQQLAAREAADNFVRALRELDPPLSRASTWADARSRMRKDPRYASVSDESTRILLFNDFVATLPSPDAKHANGASEPVPLFSSKPQGQNGAKKVEIDEETLQRLKSEHAELKAKYERMEKMLKNLEQTMAQD